MLTPFNPRHRRSPKNLQLNDVFPNWDGGSAPDNGGFFTKAEYLVNSFPWGNQMLSGYLDLAYHGSRSGDKFISPFVYKCLNEDGELTMTGVAKLTYAVQAMYWQKWTHLWNLYTTQYSPLDSYHMEEEATTDDDVDSRVGVTMELSDSTQHRGTDSLESTDTIHKTIQSTEDVRDDGHDTTTTSKAIQNAITENVTDETEHGHVITEGGSQTDATTFGKTVQDSGTESTQTAHGKKTTDSGTQQDVLQKATTVTDSGSEVESVRRYATVVDEGQPSQTDTRSVKGFNSQVFADADKNVSNIVTDNTQTTDDSQDTTTTFGKVVTNGGSDTDTTTFGKVVTNSGTDTESTTFGKKVTDGGTESDTTTFGKTETNSGTDTREIGTSRTEATNDSEEETVNYGKERYTEGENTESSTDGLESTRTLDFIDGSSSEGQTDTRTTSARDISFSSTKHGNMYRSPAELMDADRDFWLTEFFSIVFDDVDKMLTLEIYPERTPNTKFF